jgi:hypothetical protein
MLYGTMIRTVPPPSHLCLSCSPICIRVHLRIYKCIYFYIYMPSWLSTFCFSDYICQLVYVQSTPFCSIMVTYCPLLSSIIQGLLCHRGGPGCESVCNLICNLNVWNSVTIYDLTLGPLLTSSNHLQLHSLCAGLTASPLGLYLPQ